MTTGSIIRGASFSPYLYHRTWSGGDGKYDGQGKLKWNPYEMLILEQSGSPSRTTPSYFIDCSALPDSLAVAKGWNNAEFFAQTKLVGKVKNLNLNVSSAYADLDSTMKMVLHTIKSITAAATSLKKMIYHEIVGHRSATDYYWKKIFRDLRCQPRSFYAKEFAGRWLELQYGWKPLVGNIYDSFEAHDVLQQKPRKMVLTSGSSAKGTHEASMSPPNWTALAEVEYRVKVYYELTEELSTAARLDLFNPALILWERVPLSFLVDWFLPVGSYLENLQVIPKLGGRSMTVKSYKYTAVASIKNAYYYKGATCSCSVTKVTRTVGAGFSTVMPGFKRLEKALSPAHLKNALALLAVALLP